MRALQITHVLSAAALAASALLAMPAQAYSGLFVFGDSVSDSGNVGIAVGWPAGRPQTITGNSYFPSDATGFAPYEPLGTFSNGAVWSMDLAQMLHLSSAPYLAGGTNFAFAGARTGIDSDVPSLTTQVNMFLGSPYAPGGIAPADALYVVGDVGNDARDALGRILQGANPYQAAGAAAFSYATNVGAIVDTLQGAGAQHILVLNNTNLGLAPAITSFGPQAAGLATLVTGVMNGALEERLKGEVDVMQFDTFSFLTGIVSNLPAGFTNGTDACGAIADANCDQYVFWDGLHPTAAMHSAIAGAVFAQVVPEPATYGLMAMGLLLVGAAVRRRASRG